MYSLLPHYVATFHQDREDAYIFPQRVQAINIEKAVDCFMAGKYGYLLKRVTPCKSHSTTNPNHSGAGLPE